MLMVGFFAVVAVAIAGLLVKFWLDREPNDLRITWPEFGIVMFVACVVIIPGSLYFGWQMARASKLSFNEYWNGWELATEWKTIQCSRDGPCRWEYDCDPYNVSVSYSCNCDSKGNCQTCYREETHYHSCPYCNEEWTFVVKTSLGDYMIADHRLPNNPNSNRWRSSHGVPESIISHAGIGIPAFWQQVKERVDFGRPGSVTKRMQYDNYILASERTILKQYSGDIERFLSDGLLPPVQSNVHTFYYADKAQFVGYSPADTAAWQKAIGYLNAALGTELQGDLHVVIVQDARVEQNPDAYILALKAYWQNTKVFGDNTLSKNAIVVVVGTQDGQTVSWARATTGMPLGNESMLIALRNNLKGAALTPDKVLGIVQGEFFMREKDDGSKKLAVRGIHERGIMERILWGLDEPQTKFKRVSMTANDTDDVGTGFLYLGGEIEPDDGQKFSIGLGAFIISLLGWLTVVFIGEPGGPQSRNRS